MATCFPLADSVIREAALLVRVVLTAPSLSLASPPAAAAVDPGEGPVHPEPQSLSVEAEANVDAEVAREDEEEEAEEAEEDARDEEGGGLGASADRSAGEGTVGGVLEKEEEEALGYSHTDYKGISCIA
jgi:hypothetical protein